MLALSGCAIVVDDAAIACLYFDDPELSVVDGPVPDDLACGVEPSLAERLPTATVTPNLNGWLRRFVCTSLPESETCPDAAAAAGRFAPCFESSEGEGCDAPLSGYCKKEFVWSACGPDPTAIGGCCYEVFVVTTEYIS
jgi:hypothetical protein